MLIKRLISDECVLYPYILGDIGVIMRWNGLDATEIRDEEDLSAILNKKIEDIPGLKVLRAARNGIEYVGIRFPQGDSELYLIGEDADRNPETFAMVTYIDYLGKFAEALSRREPLDTFLTYAGMPFMPEGPAAAIYQDIMKEHCAHDACDPAMPSRLYSILEKYAGIEKI